MNRKTTFTSLLILAIGLSACNLPFGQPLSGQDEPGDEPPPQQPAASNTPEFTFTPSNTPLPTLTYTPQVPMVSVSVDTNCRTGPGQPYDIVGVLHVGETAEVVGQAPYGGSWIIKNPDGAGTCWLWDQYATVIGDTQGLPIYDIPPTPTPAASFTVSYLQMISCLGDYAFRFQLVNTGSVTWRSYLVVVTDSTTSTVKSFSWDDFMDRLGCGPAVNILLDLEPGETGVAGNWGASGPFPYNPTGHNMTATFTLYEQDGLAGQSKTVTIAFNP
ncbi:MAG: SH3 domain-containing protein [Chloroflexota bacterium]